MLQLLHLGRGSGSRSDMADSGGVRAVQAGSATATELIEPLLSGAGAEGEAGRALGSVADDRGPAVLSFMLRDRTLRHPRFT
jgi:hypothetical protein